MALDRLRFLLLALAALLLAPAATRGAAPPEDLIERKPPSLAGQLLVASERIGDPRFARTVILLARHGKDGAFGITINRPVATRTLASLLAMLGETGEAAEGSIEVLAGGPVQPGVGFLVHSADYRRPETIAVDARLAVTSSRDALLDVARGKGPLKALIAFGYAGWAPGQLEAEIARDAWFTAPADPRLVFEEDRGRVWQEAVARRMRDL